MNIVVSEMGYESGGGTTEFSKPLNIIKKIIIFWFL